MTHEYVIALGGTVVGAGSAEAQAPTAVAWAADRVLAVGSDDIVRGISRGDSTFLDLAGCAVTALPVDLEAAETILRAAIAAGHPFDAAQLLADAGQIDSPAGLETGAPADLAFWSAPPDAIPPGSATTLRIIAVVRAGAFTEGDEHRGPFSRARGPSVS